MLLTLLALSLLVIASCTLGTFLHRRRQRTLEAAIREQAHQKMLDHWAAQELHGATMILDGRELAQAWAHMGLLPLSRR